MARRVIETGTPWVDTVAFSLGVAADLLVEIDAVACLPSRGG